MKHGVHDVVRVCEPTYKTDELKKAGISVMDLVFDDGTFPPAEVRFAFSSSVPPVFWSFPGTWLAYA